ncbi:MAG: DoxX family membrane protein [Deltaproteobacteria bacterium]|nr:DoxX family membrane protein [Deltaproteobacteria bacterium]
MRSILTWQGHGWLCLPARIYLGCIFLLACVHKIAHPGSFAIDIDTYDILPIQAVNLMAITLPWVELVVGLFLLLGVATRAAAMAGAGMLVMFLAAVLVALARGMDMSCGCFASQAVANEDPISYWTILRDSAWLVTAMYIAVFDRRAIGLARLAEGLLYKPHK